MSESASKIEKLYSKDEKIRAILKHIEEYGEKYNNFKTKNDVAIFYKIDLVPNFPGVDLYTYLDSFNKTKLNNDIKPTFKEMSKWSSEMVSLCKNAVKKIEDFDRINNNKIIYAAHPLRKYRTHKTKTDNTNYSEWRHVEVDLKYSDLKIIFLNEKESHERILEMI